MWAESARAPLRATAADGARSAGGARHRRSQREAELSLIRPARPEALSWGRATRAEARAGGSSSGTRRRAGRSVPVRRPTRPGARRRRLSANDDPQTGAAPGQPGATMCVQDADDRCVLQFTLHNAAGCALHRRASRVIHRSELCFARSGPR